MLTAEDIVTYYATNKPFEITDPAKYLSMLQNVAEFTVLEFSENQPIISEKNITSTTSTTNEYVELDLYQDIDERFMSFVCFEEKSKIDSMTNRILSSYFGVPEELAAIRKAVDSGSLINFLAVRDSIHAMEEWYHLNVAKIIFNRSKIKVLPNTEYYCLYKRYLTLAEISPSELNNFKKLLFINLLLGAYRSEIYASEAGIRSVSISSLSVSFNVSSPTEMVRSLEAEKEKTMAELAMVYDEDMIGIV